MLTIEPIGTPHFDTDQARAIYQVIEQKSQASLHEIGAEIGVRTHGGTPPTLTHNYRRVVNSEYVEPGENGPLVYGQDCVEDIVGFRVTDA